MLKFRNFVIKVFEYTILVWIIVGCLAALVLGIGMMVNPFYGSSPLMGILYIAVGFIGSFATGGAGLLLVGIYENTRRAL